MIQPPPPRKNKRWATPPDRLDNSDEWVEVARGILKGQRYSSDEIRSMIIGLRSNSHPDAVSAMEILTESIK